MEDDSTFEDLAAFVEAIVEMCVDKPGSDGFGGRLKFGEKGLMKVVVQGTIPDPDDKGRDYYTHEPTRARPAQAATPPARPVVGFYTESAVLDMRVESHLDELRHLLRGMSIQQHVPNSVLIDDPPPSGLQRTGNSKRSIVYLSGT